MKHQIARTVPFMALLLSLAVVAPAQADPSCSAARVSGDWGYTKTGILFLPTGAAVPFATIGKLTLEANGDLFGMNNGSVNGAVSTDVLQGSFQVNADCTGSMTVDVYDQFGTLLRTIGMALVVDDDAKEIRGLVMSLTLPNGTGLRSVITAQAKRVTRDE